MSDPIDLVPIAGYQWLGGRVVQAAVIGGTGGPIKVPGSRNRKLDNAGRTVQLKVTTNGGAAHALGTVTVEGRMNPLDSDGWAPVVGSAAAGLIAFATEVPTDAGAHVYVTMTLLFDYRELRVISADIAGCDSVDYELYIGT